MYSSIIYIIVFCIAVYSPVHGEAAWKNPSASASAGEIALLKMMMSRPTTTQGRDQREKTECEGGDMHLLNIALLNGLNLEAQYAFECIKLASESGTSIIWNYTSSVGSSLQKKYQATYTETLYTLLKYVDVDRLSSDVLQYC